MGTLKYRQFFSTLALASGAATSLGLVLSLPTSFTVLQVHADNATNTVPYTDANTSLLTPDARDTDFAMTRTDVLQAPLPILPTTIARSTTTPSIKNEKVEVTTTALTLTTKTDSVFTVPFYSQFTDITAPAWKKVACGITSLAMLIEYYHPNKIASVDTLLHEGIDVGAYNDAAGWSYNGLIIVARKYGLGGSTHDYKDSTMDVAFKAFSKDLQKGPIMASVHYTFKASNPIPHLVIINGIKDGLVYYNDPASYAGAGTVSVAQFKEGWKKRYIEFFPVA